MQRGYNNIKMAWSIVYKELNVMMSDAKEKMITVDLDICIDRIPEIFATDFNEQETIFVLDRERKLCGIITIGDFLRKGRSAQSITELMNANFIKIDISQINNANDINATADEIFIKKPTVRKIPVVDSENNILFTITRGKYNQYEYVFDFNVNDFMRILEFQNDGDEIVELLKLMEINSIAVLKEDRLLEFVGAILSKDFIVDFYENAEAFEQTPGYERKYDMVLLKDRCFSPQAIKFSFKGMFVQDWRFLFRMNEFMVHLLESLNKLSKIVDKMLLFIQPRICEIKNPSTEEVGLVNKLMSYDAMLNGVEVYGNERSEYLSELIYAPSILKRNGESFVLDSNRKYFNSLNGRRITTDAEGEYDNKIFILGNSVALGYFNEDKNTIPSYMQRILNNSQKKYKVVNCGVLFELSIFNVLEEAVEGDIIVILLILFETELFKNLLAKKNIKNIVQYPLNHLFDRPHNMGEVYFDQYHINHIGNKAVAEEIIRVINKNPGVGVVKNHISVSLTENDDSDLFALGLSDYLNSLEKYKTGAKNCGAIVMNCNPFTNGHKYLAEYAAERCEHLYIFVVSEDMSYFKYEERMALVKEGTSHIKNVTVLSSGRFLVSSITMPGYFNKDQPNLTAVDLTLDCNIFARHIANALNIKKRFAGEEPLCYYTNQYNKIMSELLPRYGITFYEIPRKEANGKPVSASFVRELLGKKDFDKIKEIVPHVTYEYLLETFGGKVDG